MTKLDELNLKDTKKLMMKNFQLAKLNILYSVHTVKVVIIVPSAPSPSLMY